MTRAGLLWSVGHRNSPHIKSRVCPSGVHQCRCGCTAAISKRVYFFCVCQKWLMHWELMFFIYIPQSRLDIVRWILEGHSGMRFLSVKFQRLPPQTVIFWAAKTALWSNFWLWTLRSRYKFEKYSSNSSMWAKYCSIFTRLGATHRASLTAQRVIICWFQCSMGNLIKWSAVLIMSARSKTGKLFRSDWTWCASRQSQIATVENKNVSIVIVVPSFVKQL